MRRIIIVALLAASAMAHGQTGPPKPQASDPACRTWQWVNPRPESRNLESVVAGASGVVAVGDHGTILFSPEGISWRAVNSGTTAFLHDVVWTGQAFFAVGDGGTVVTSANGLSWAPLVTDTTLDLSSVAFGAGVLVAIGPDATLLTSSDGASWTVTEFCDPEWCSMGTDDVVWTGTQFVVVGPKMSAVSPDGLQWQVGGSLYWGEGSSPWALAWNGSEILALSDYANGIVIWKSTDGLTWGHPVEQFGLYATNIVWLEGMLFAVGHPYWTYETSDLSSWTTTFLPFEMPLNSVAWTGERFVGVGEASQIVTSPSGFNWTAAQIADGNLGRFKGLAGGNGTLVAAQDRGDTGVSTDGFEWSTVPRVTYFQDATFGNGRFVGVDRTKSAVSIDGLGWSLFPTGTHGLHAVEWVGDRFLAGGGYPYRIMGSTDGESWSVEFPETGSGNSLFALGAGDGRAVGVGTYQYFTPLVLIERSQGSWEETYPFNKTDLKGSLHDITYGAGRWVAVGSFDAIVTSIDLDSWQIIDPEGTNFLYSVSWNGSEFLATGWNGAVFSSPDGLVWTRETTPTQLTLYSSEWFDGAWYAAGRGGAILRGGCTWPSDPPVAAFTFEPTNPAPGDIVRFTDASTGYATSWLWLFGGGYSTAVNPAHVYSATGSYNVTQTVCNGNACDTATVQVPVAERSPEAAFAWRFATLLANEPATWIDLSTGPPASWAWVFGDGGASSERMPVHAYAEPGIYTARLQVSNGFGTDRAEAQVVVGPAPVVATSESESYADIVWNGSQWLAVRNTGVAISADGVEWTEHTFADRYFVRAVGWTGEKYLITGTTTYPDYHGFVAASDDGVTWSFTDLEGTGLNDVASCDGITVVVGGNGRVLVSSDLASWQEGSSGTTDYIRRVACGDGLFVATVSESPGIIESTNGLTWSPAAIESDGAGAIVWAENHFYADTDRYRTGVVMRLPDGSWTQAAEGIVTLDLLSDLAIINGKILASLSEYYAQKDGLWWFSPELSTWVPIDGSGGGRMEFVDDTLMILENRNIHRLDVQPQRLLADGFESGDLSAWSVSIQ